jgi:hypothetical protein
MVCRVRGDCQGVGARAGRRRSSLSV